MPPLSFHPAITRWFEERIGAPTDAQLRAWPLVGSEASMLLAAPTGSGKTLAAFLAAIDQLARRGDALEDRTEILYVSPLKALGNDVQKNLQRPLAELRELDPSLPEVRVLVRTGDTPQSARQAMLRRPPHILVTTPESLYILLSSQGGRGMLEGVRTVIVDEIHAVLGDKRGSHLALSLERLEALAGPVQRVGLSATQKPVEDVARFLMGCDRHCEIIDVGHHRELELAIEVPDSPLEAVVSHETFGEVYARIAELALEHRTTLVFVNTRKLSERVAAELAKLLGDDLVTCHHSSISRERRLDAEERLKRGELRALVATASLELGIDIGDVDLVVQIGSTRSIAMLLQRVGRAGHAPGRVPRGRLFPLTIDDLGEAAALSLSIHRGLLDRTPQPGCPMDILAQQIVAECVGGEQDENELFESFRRAWPFRQLTRVQFDEIVALHTGTRHALLHRDTVGGRLMATKRARLAAITCGGAIPDAAEYRVVQDPEGLHVGSVHEDFAIEASAGDIFQLGNTSWRILKVETPTVRVADARGAPPTLPFWFGEAPARTPELSEALSEVRERGVDIDWLERECGLPRAAAEQLSDYLDATRKTLGALPTTRRVVLERFFDETGGMQLVLHAPFGGRINRAWGLALRKRFCRGFGFELQAAANEDAIIISLGLQHGFELEGVFGYLHTRTARDVLVQALLPAPMFETRWRWNVSRALLVERFRSGKKVPVALLRMRAQDLLVQAFPDVLACPETLPGGDLPVPMDHPMVAQTIHDCLTEAMDVDGFLRVLDGIESGEIETVAIDTPEPSPLARSILNARPYAFLDDAPLEERRTQAVMSRRIHDVRVQDDLGALDAAAVARVREEAWPQPESAEEVHEALLWMGYVTTAEAAPWKDWLAELLAARRVSLEDGRWFAIEAGRDALTMLRGRMDALGPVFEDDPLFAALEAEGHVLRVRLDGKSGWCARRLLARIHRYTVDRLRREIEPVSAEDFLRFLAAWQHAAIGERLEGPRGVALALERLAAFEAPAASWESSLLPARVQPYRRDWLDMLTLTGEWAWGRLWGGGAAPVRSAPITFVPRQQLEAWCALAAPVVDDQLTGAARDLHDALASRGALFPGELESAAGLLQAQVEMGLAELIAWGAVTCDSFAALRQLLVPPSRRRRRVVAVGRYSLLGRGPADGGATVSVDQAAEMVARQLLARYGVVFRRVITRERMPVSWRDVLRVCRRLELAGELRGGRFVAGMSGEQYALPEAVDQLRAVRRQEPLESIKLSAADPLNLQGIITPQDRIPATTRTPIELG